MHYNNTIEEQVRHVAKAKQHTPGMVVTPMVFLPSDPISKIDALKVSFYQANQESYPMGLLFYLLICVLDCCSCHFV